MNGILNISNLTDFIGGIVRYSGNGNYIEDVVLSADSVEDRVRLHLVNGDLVFTNLNLKEKQ